MVFYNRQTKCLEQETQSNKYVLKFLYKTIGGRILLKTIFARPLFSKTCSLYLKSPLSKKDIFTFVKKHNMKIKKAELSKYDNFNEFFTRKKRIFVQNYSKNTLIAPADSKMKFYKITDDLKLDIKNSSYSVEDILGNKKLASKFKNGVCIVFRLSTSDYHRYHFIDNGRILSRYHINGELHTVRPISSKYNVFTRNAREVTIMHTENLGTMAQIEVGALLVGKIRNHKKNYFKRYEEKGYFEFGGSTIVLFLNKDIEFDKDIQRQNVFDVEIQVKACEKIGVLK